MSAGGSSSSSDTRFSRTGTVQNESWRELTDDHRSLFSQAFGQPTSSDLGQTMAGAVTTKMNRGFSDIPNIDALCPLVKNNMPNVGIAGFDSLNRQAAQDPFSSTYADETFGKYRDEVQRALASGRSGPVMSRGGTAAEGYMLGDVANQIGLQRQQVLAQHRVADAGIQQQAAGLMGQLRGAKDQTALQGLQLGYNNYQALLADQSTAATLANDRFRNFGALVPHLVGLDAKSAGVENNNLSGRGSQSSQAVGAGVNICCFIFLEAYNGVLPESVRRYRDMAAPESSARRNGYRRMSKWLVPAMRVNGFSRTLVNHLLVKPLTKYGEWFYGNNKTGWIFWPVKQFWFSVWSLTGKEQNK